ncbi:MAG: hypothetical protein ACI4A3_07765 [Lachnospiraceae bacterium]
MDNKKENVIGNVATVAIEGYDYSVAKRMMGRAGSYSPVGGKGNALEIMYCDKKNVENCLNTGKLNTRLTNSSTATQSDLITMNGKKIAERIQCKDTPSVTGTAKTIKQVQNGQYKAAQLVGTSESASAYNSKAASKGVSKVMKDSGISTKETSRISNKFNGVSSATGITNAVKTSAKTGGVLSGGVAAIESFANGDDFSTATKNVTSSALKGSVSGGVGTAASEATMVALAAAPIPLAAKVGIGIVSGIAAGSFASEVTSDICEGVGEVASGVVEGVSDVVSEVAGGISDICRGIFGIW